MPVSFMSRFLAMLTFAACTIPIAGCSAIRKVEAPPGPMQCDPTEAASPRLMGLAFGPREGFKIYSTEFLSEVA